jgi:nucleoside-diphosphate-sugar epimerase
MTKGHTVLKGRTVTAPAGLSADVVAADLEDVVDRTADLWGDLRGARILLTGATGFFGAWLLASFAAADRRLALGARAVVVTRDPERCRRRMPAISAWPVQFVRADVRQPLPVGGAFDAAVCAATASSGATGATTPGETFSTIVAGTTNTIDAVAPSGAVPFLLVSSGAVYGPQPRTVARVGEDEQGAAGPVPPPARFDHAFAYAEGKRDAERLCARAAAEGARTTVARCFSFVGPYLPLDQHFAIGNFIGDAAAGRPIEVAGDGTTVRSWMYPSDLAVWLWTVLSRGAAGRAYNVGSEVACSVREAAELVARLAPSPLPVVVRGDASADRGASHYVPSTARAGVELGLRMEVPLEDALARTLQWVRAR